MRFVSENDGVHSIREEFLEFQSAEDLSGAGLSKYILALMRKLRLDSQNLVGQGYDGAAAMSGAFNGVQAHVSKAAPQAVYVHCGSHALNLVLNSACDVPEIRDMFTTVSTIIVFINKSLVRRGILADILNESNETGCLKTFCATRFIERHDSLIVFYKYYGAVVSCLESIVQHIGNKDSETFDKARSYVKAITEPVFIVALCCAKKLMTLTVGLSRSLQTVNQELVEAVTEPECVKKTIHFL